MRILFLDQFSEFGGAQLCLRDVLVEVQRRGWGAELMAPGNGPLLRFARDCGFDARSLPIQEYSNIRKAAADFFRFGMGIARVAALLRRALRDKPADLVYVNGPRLLPAAVQRKIPVLFHAHSMAGRKYAQAIVNWSLRRTNATAISCSQFAAKPVQEAIGADAVRVVYNGVGDCGFRARTPHRGPLRIGLLGRIAPEKGHFDFIRAAQLLAGNPDLRFSVIGAALFSDRVYEHKIRSLCADAGIEMRGWINDIAGILHNLDILAVPSAANEASTRVVMEALSASTCVIAYPSGGLPELVRNGYSGLLTEHRDATELAQAIRMLAQNPELRSRLAENGRKEWETRFTVERFQREVCDRMEAFVDRRALATSEIHSTKAAVRSSRDATSAWPGS